MRLEVGGALRFRLEASHWGFRISQSAIRIPQSEKDWHLAEWFETVGLPRMGIGEMGGEVPPASPARYDLTKLGEAEITGVTTPYRLYHRGGWPGWSCWHCR